MNLNHSPDAADCIVGSHLTRIFGRNTEDALEMLRQGYDASSIKEATGCTAAVMDASFSVHKGEIFVIMGLSGSGKSTLVRMINGLMLPSDGSLLVEGADVTRMCYSELVALRRNTVTMVFQSFALLPHLNLLDNVGFGLKVGGVSEAERCDIAARSLAQVHLEGYGDRYPDELSGGQQQRVGLARALAVDPDILLMDEAFSALDPLIRAQMQDELLALQESRRRTIVFISHDLEEAFRIGDRIAVMQDGRIAQIGTPQEILLQPANDYIKAFFRSVDTTQVLTAGQIAQRPPAVMAEREGFGVSNAITIMERRGTLYGVVTDLAGRYRGMVDMDQLVSSAGVGFETPLSATFVAGAPVPAEALLKDLLGRVGESRLPVAVVGDGNRFLGVLGKAQLLLTLDRTV